MKLFCPQCQKTYEGEYFELCPEDGARLFRLDEPQSEDPLLGAIVDGRFRIEELLGAGGMGAVYRGVQLSVNREVAIKVLRPELAGREQALERFFREAKVVSELTHPNIVRLIEFGQDRERDLLYLVMELVRGADMGELLRRGRFRTNLALEVVYQICGALTEPHARGIVHRDLKPENVVLLPISDGTMQVKVLDFGIARTLERGTQLTKTGMICGTPSYMAPEQAQNLELDGRTDLYALGIILYEMLCGTPPFTGESSLQILLQHIQLPAPDLLETMPAGSVPEPVADLVRQLLEKEPEQRPRSARAVRDRIDDLRMELQLRPLRLLAGADEEDPFEAWILPRTKLLSGRREAVGASELGFESVEEPRRLTEAETLVLERTGRSDREGEAFARTLASEPEVGERAWSETMSRAETAVVAVERPVQLASNLRGAPGTEELTEQSAAVRFARADKRRIIGISLVAVVILIGGVLALSSDVEQTEGEPLEGVVEPSQMLVIEEPDPGPLHVEPGEEVEEVEEVEPAQAVAEEIGEGLKEEELVEEEVAERPPAPAPAPKPAPSAPPKPEAPKRRAEAQSDEPERAEVQQDERPDEREESAGALERARRDRQDREPADKAPTNEELQRRLRSLRSE